MLAPSVVLSCESKEGIANCAKPVLARRYPFAQTHAIATIQIAGLTKRRSDIVELLCKIARTDLTQRAILIVVSVPQTGCTLPQNSCVRHSSSDCAREELQFLEHDFPQKVLLKDSFRRAVAQHLHCLFLCGFHGCRCVATASRSPKFSVR